MLMWWVFGGYMNHSRDSYAPIRFEIIRSARLMPHASRELEWSYHFESIVGQNVISSTCSQIISHFPYDNNNIIGINLFLKLNTKWTSNSAFSLTEFY